jgi:hypothetical protein
VTLLHCPILFAVSELLKRFIGSGPAAANKFSTLGYHGFFCIEMMLHPLIA